MYTDIHQMWQENSNLKYEANGPQKLHTSYLKPSVVNMYMLTRSLVLYMNPWDSIAILIEIPWGIYWPTLYLPNLSNSLLHQSITMAYFIRSLIYLFLNVCSCELSCAGWSCSYHAACKYKQITAFLLAKIVFMSKVLDSQNNDLQRFGKYKVGQ